MARNTKCLVGRCPKQARTRGLCYACYSNARIMIKKGEATEDALVLKGLLNAKLVKKGSNLLKEQFNLN